MRSNKLIVIDPMEKEENMLEINENSSVAPLQSTFLPLKELKEFLLVKELQDEN